MNLIKFFFRVFIVCFLEEGDTVLNTGSCTSVAAAPGHYG